MALTGGDRAPDGYGRWEVADRMADERPDPVRIRLCGDVAVAAPDGTWHPVRGRQPRLVLAYLVLEGRRVRREELADVLWGERPSDHWPGALRGVLSKVRGVLGAASVDADAVRSEDTTIRLDLPVRSDIDLADDEVTAGEALLGAGTAEQALAAAERATAALAGPFLPHEDGDWSQRQRLRIESLVRRAAQLDVQALVELDRYADAADRARQYVEQHPLDEAMHHELIASLLTDGRRTEAVHAFRTLRDILGSELGIAPATRTASLLDTVDRARKPPRPSRRGEASPTAFVGRADERADLERTWARVLATGRPELVVLVGPGGIGKTRLAQYFAECLAAGGATTVWGHNRADDGRAFGAVADVVSGALDADPGVLDRADERACGLVPLLPELAARFPDYRQPSDHAEARTHLYSAVPVVLRELSRSPTIIVLDDLHWAPDDTLSLLEAAVAGLDGRLLLLATARDTPSSWEPALATIQRLLPVQTLRLEPLDATELAELVAGHPPPLDDGDIELAAAIHERTAGLPFFASEIIRSSLVSGEPIDPSDLPSAVRDWIRRRTAALPPHLLDVLSTAAVIGDEVDLALLERCVRGDDIDTAVDELVRHGLLRDTGAADAISFAHAITREVIYGGLGAARRMRLHRVVGDAIAASPDAPGRSEVVAHHARRAGSDRRGIAAAFACEAGGQAMAIGAWDRAVEQFQHSLESSDTPIATARAMIGLGEARLRQLRFDEARELLEGAADMAAAEGLAFELAEATLALVGRRGRGVSAERAVQIERLRAARSALAQAGVDRGSPGGDDRRRSMLLSNVERELAVSLLLTEAVDERAELVAGALQRARAVEPVDPPTLAAALAARRILPEMAALPDARIADIEEALRLPTSQISPDLRIVLHCYRQEDLLQCGDRPRAAAALDQAFDLVDRYPDPYWRWALTSWRALGLVVDGDLDSAEAVAHAASNALPGVWETAACLGVNVVNIRLYQRRAAEVLDLLDHAARRSPQIPCYRAVLALAASEAGERRLAEDHYRWFADARFENLPLDTNRFLALAVLGHVATDLGDTDGAVDLEPLLEPFDDQWVVLNCFGGGGAHWGPTAHVLARLAELAGDTERAQERYGRALASAAGAPLVLERIARHATLAG